MKRLTLAAVLLLSFTAARPSLAQTPRRTANRKAKSAAKAQTAPQAAAPSAPARAAQPSAPARAPDEEERGGRVYSSGR